LPGWTKRGALTPSEAGTPVHEYRIVREYPHDPEAFTQGLIYWNGFLYESTGPTGRSSLRKVRLDTGEVVMRRRLNDTYFGEGLTEWRGRLVQLTPMRTTPTHPSAAGTDRQLLPHPLAARAPLRCELRCEHRLDLRHRLLRAAVDGHVSRRGVGSDPATTGV
jgi:hypothetical protein